MHDRSATSRRIFCIVPASQLGASSVEIGTARQTVACSISTCKCDDPAHRRCDEVTGCQWRPNTVAGLRATLQQNEAIAARLSLARHHLACTEEEVASGVVALTCAALTRRFLREYASVCLQCGSRCEHCAERSVLRRGVLSCPSASVIPAACDEVLSRDCATIQSLTRVIAGARTRQAPKDHLRHSGQVCFTVAASPAGRRGGVHRRTLLDGREASVRQHSGTCVRDESYRRRPNDLVGKWTAASQVARHHIIRHSRTACVGTAPRPNDG